MQGSRFTYRFSGVLIFLLMLFCNSLYSQKNSETIVVGSVYDSYTLQPIVNANVYFRGTQIGCATQQDGLFMLRSNSDKQMIMIVSAVGYKKQRYVVESGQQVGVEILLDEDNTMLQDVFVRPDNRQVMQLMQRVKENRQRNNTISTSMFQFSEQNNLYLSNLTQRQLSKKIFRGLDKGLITINEDEQILPLYTSKTNYSQRSGKSEQIGESVEKSIALSEDNYSVLLNGLPHWLNFYENNISIFDKNFISPLSSISNSHYNYYLTDSILSATGKIYTIDFRSKNPFEPTFNGQMQIDSLTASLREISISIPNEVNINYLSTLRASQVYDDNNMPKSENVSMVFNLVVKTDTTGIFPTVLLEHKSQNTSYNTKDSYIDNLSFDAHNKCSQSANNANDSVIQQKMQEIEDSPVIKWAKFFAHIINTGNVPMGGKVDVGNIVEVINYSRYEGLHLGVPLTTNEKLWKNVELSGYIGYGFKDRSFKGCGQIIVKLPTEHRHLIGAHYWDHYVQTDISPLDYKMHENTIFYGSEDFSYLLFGNIRYSHQAANTATRRREFRIWTENEWNQNIETEFNFRIGKMGYGSPYVGYKNIESYKFTTLQAGIRVGFDEKKVDMFMRRYYVHSHYPVLRTMLEVGTYQTTQMSNDNMYARLSFLMQHKVRMGRAGQFDYTLGAGLIIGAVPYPLLEHFVGNQGYTYDPYRFTLLNSYQYAADKYTFAHLHWNFQGLLFNKIPGIRYLKLRELLELKFAYGTLSEKNIHFQPVKSDANSYIALPYDMKQMPTPYIEAGVGIGNILRIIDLYGVFRLTNLKDTTTPWWGIRARFSLGL